MRGRRRRKRRSGVHIVMPCTCMCSVDLDIHVCKHPVCMYYYTCCNSPRHCSIRDKLRIVKTTRRLTTIKQFLKKTITAIIIIHITVIIDSRVFH